MEFEQFYLACLSHASYLVGDRGEAAIVDPQRDVDLYLEAARARGLSIRWVFETHLHADFVSGHRELAERTGATIVLSAAAGAAFPHQAAKDGDVFHVGRVPVTVLATPGHTPEGVCYVVDDPDLPGAAPRLLTGDTLFVGDVGRPDLVTSKGYTGDDMAGMLYDSLHGKLLALPDAVKVYPAHGAGSMCGRNISSERSSTIGRERQFNYALRPMSRDEFVRMMTVDLPERPAYFSLDAEINRAGPPLLDQSPAPSPLGVREVERLRDARHVVLDTRPAAQYGTGHVPGSLNIGLGGQFASWAGSLIPADAGIVLVAEEEERVREARTRLARVGLEKVAGYLDGGVLEWDRAGLALSATEQISVEELAHRLHEAGAPQVVDVRRPAEWGAGHIPGALHIPLNHLAEGIRGLERALPYAVVCAGGYRSSIATSILERAGFERITNVVGGMTAWVNARLAVEGVSG